MENLNLNDIVFLFLSKCLLFLPLSCWEETKGKAENCSSDFHYKQMDYQIQIFTVFDFHTEKAMAQKLLFLLNESSEALQKFYPELITDICLLFQIEQNPR